MNIEHTSIIKSFSSEPDEASIIWNELINKIPFGELDAASIRMLPMVYNNVKNEIGIPHREQLKGAYRYNWTINAKNIQKLKLFLKEIEHLDYRILKGWALNFKTSKLGQRVTGDLDILISKEDFIELIGILKKNQYTHKFDTPCPLNPLNNLPIGGFDITYSKIDQIEIDVHLENTTTPTKLFQEMLKIKPEKIIWNSIIIKIPTAEHLLAHSLIHGYQKVNPTDQIQTIGDFEILKSFIDPQRFVQICSKLNINHILSQLDSTVNVEFQFTKFKKQIRNLTRVVYICKKLLNKNDFSVKSLKIIRLIRLRKKSKESLRIIRAKFNGRALSYYIWLKTGSLRPLEAFFDKYLFFLSAPSRPIVMNNVYTLFSGERKIEINESNVAKESQDWRFIFRVPLRTSRINVILEHELFKIGSFAIFVNGKLKGTTNLSSRYNFELNYPNDRIEISIRNPLHSCLNCGIDVSALKFIVNQLSI